MAISQIKAKDGTTPVEVVSTLLFFAKGSVAGSKDIITSEHLWFDDSYFRSVLMLALSQVSHSTSIDMKKSISL